MCFHRSSYVDFDKEYSVRAVHQNVLQRPNRSNAIELISKFVKGQLDFNNDISVSLNKQ